MRLATNSKARTGRQALFCLGVAFVALAFAASASAAPSKFVYETCDPALPGGNPPAAKFTANPGQPFSGVQACGSLNGGIGIHQYGNTSGTFAWWSIDIPATPGGYIESLAISASACGLGAANNNSFVYEQRWPPSCGETQRVFRVRNSLPSGPFAFVGVGFRIMLNCDGNQGICNAGPSLAARYLAATQVDMKPPTLSGLAGSVLAGGVLRGTHDLRVEAGDVGGGISKIEVSVNGLPAGQPVVANCGLGQVANPNAQGTVALTPTPCPAKLKGEWSLDTAAYPFQGGENAVQVCVSDFSTITDANKTCSAPQTVTVDNSCTESAVPGGEAITAQFVRSRRDEVTVPFNTPAKVVGELSNQAGDAIRGATICVQMKTQGAPGGLKPITTVTTDSQGHFTYKVPAGPNRKVLLGYRTNRFQVADSVRYRAKGKPTMKLSKKGVRTGGEIKITGKLPGGQRAAGRVVVLEAGAVGGQWYTFDKVTTNRRGRYKARLRFDDTSRTITYEIRANAPRQRDWPFEESFSEPVRVTVKAGG